MPNGVGQGIATGLTNAISLALQSKGFDLREERTQALTDIGERRLDISERELALKEGEFRPTNEQLQLEFETKQEANQLAVAKARQEQEEAIEQAEREKPSMTAQTYLEKISPEGKYTPRQIEMLQQRIDVQLLSKKRGDLVPEASINEMMVSDLDTDNPDNSGAEWQKRWWSAGAEQAINQAEVFDQETEKAIKKNPILGTNPEAANSDQEFSEKVQASQELKATAQHFKELEAEADDVAIQSTAKEKARQEQRQSEQVAFIDSIIRAREGGAGKQQPFVSPDTGEFAGFAAPGQQPEDAIPLNVAKFREGKSLSLSQASGESAQRLRGQRAQGRENLLLFDQEVETLMSAYRIPPERRGEVEDLLEGDIADNSPEYRESKKREELVNKLEQQTAGLDRPSLANFEVDTARSWLELLGMTPLIGGRSIAEGFSERVE